MLRGLDGYGGEVSGSRGCAPAILCSVEPRSGAFDNRHLGIAGGCRLGQLLASVPLMDHRSGRHGKALWAGDMDEEQLESEGSNSQSHMVSVVHSFGDFQM